MSKNHLHRFASKLKKELLQKQAWCYPECMGGWRKYGKAPVLGGEDSDDYFDPFVRYEMGKYLMYVSNRTRNTVESYISQNGVDWQREDTVLYGANDGAWDEIVNRACYLKMNAVWYLWYTGQSGGKSAIGLALSHDGKHYERYGGNPIIMAETTFEGNSVMNPSVIWDEDNKIFRMWYSAGDDYEPDCICYAESKDGIKWLKRFGTLRKADSKKKYEKFKIGACDVIKFHKNYYMFYIAYQNLHIARICMAKSPDGIDWTECESNPILSPSKNMWDCHSVYKPTVYADEKNKKILLWYNGRRDLKEGIGLAYRNGDIL